MHRNERTSFIKLLGAIHARKETPALSSAWREDVMNEIARTGWSRVRESDWERLAPRFSLAAAALSAVMIVTTGGSLISLPDLISQAYSYDLFNIVPMTMSSL